MDAPLTLAVPALLLFGVRVVRRRSAAGIAALAAVALVGFSYVPKLMAKPAFAPGRHPSLGWILASSPYVLIGSMALAVAAVCEIHSVAAARTARRKVSRPTWLAAWSRIVDS